MKVKILGLAMLALLTACADLSMYRQVPAPVGDAAGGYPVQRSPIPLETFPLDDAVTIRPTDSLANVPSPAIIALLDDAHRSSEQGQFNVAAAKLERAVRISPRDPQIWHQLAKIRLAQQQYELAISLAKKSNLLAANNQALQANNWLLIADSFTHLGQIEPANKAKAQARRLF